MNVRPFAALLCLVVGCSTGPLPTQKADSNPPGQTSPGSPGSAGSAGSAGSDLDVASTAAAIRSLHQVKGKPQPGDWLDRFPESGQTFAQWLATDAYRPTFSRRTIAVQPIGSFTPTQHRILNLTAEALSLYYGLPVSVEDPLPLSVVPKWGHRRHPKDQHHQILSGAVTRHVLIPRFPKDAAVYLGFIANDLWPGEDWNFVFGEALSKRRVGIWSLHRLGDADASPEDFKTALLRAIKIATHETGHMFGFDHCTAYACNMNGSNSLEETDEAPLWSCPECVAKIWSGPATNTPVVTRYTALTDFCNREGLHTEAAFFEKSAALVRR